MNVVNQFIFGHCSIANSHIEAQYLFHLKLDCALQVVNLGLDIILMSQERWKFTSLVKTRSQQSRDLFNQRFGSHEGIVLFGKFLNLFLVLVEFLQIFGTHVRNVLSFSFIAMLLVTKDAYGELWSWDVLKLDGSRETLVLLRIVVLKANLKVDCLGKLPLLSLGRVLEYLTDTLEECILRNLGCHVDL